MCSFLKQKDVCKVRGRGSDQTFILGVLPALDLSDDQKFSRHAAQQPPADLPHQHPRGGAGAAADACPGRRAAGEPPPQEGAHPLQPRAAHHQHAPQEQPPGTHPPVRQRQRLGECRGGGGRHALLTSTLHGFQKDEGAHQGR